MAWRREFVRTFVERDVPGRGIRIAPATLRRFWTMLAHYHGNGGNSSEFARSFGVADTTVRNYLDLLSLVLVVRQLQSWHANVAKRQVKASKVYLVDSGLLHAHLNLPRQVDVEGHPKAGASWEGFAIDECFFRATHSGAELDLLVVRGGSRRGFEMKHTSSPVVTPSMRSALADLKLDSLDVVHAGDRTFDFAPRVRAVGLSRLLVDVPPL